MGWVGSMGIWIILNNSRIKPKLQRRQRNVNLRDGTQGTLPAISRGPHGGKWNPKQSGTFPVETLWHCSAPIFGLWEASSHPKVDGIMWRRLAETVQLDTAVPFPVLSAPGLLENVGVPFQWLGTPIRSKTKKSYIYIYPIYGILPLEYMGLYGFYIFWIINHLLSGMCICTLLLEFLFLPADVE